MAVTLTVSETMDGAAVADALAGGGSGVDLGSVVNNAFAPITDKTANTGSQKLYISHDATIDPITQVGTFLESYVATGFTYGGANSAALDLTSLTNLGNASGSSKNNSNGLSGGLWIDMDADASVTNQFDQAGFPSLVKIYGDNGTDGLSLVTAFTMKANALLIDTDQGAGNDGEGNFLPTAPVDGQIGKDGDTALGDNAKVKLRIYLPLTHPDGGIHQWSWTIKYSFTA
jgi:hypothetical protein